MQGIFDSVYATFVDRVAQGRGLTPERVAPLAQGRVWSGSRARQHGLVDAIGGPLDALREVCRRAGLAEGERYLLESHPRLPHFPGWLGLLRFLPGRTSTW